MPAWKQFLLSLVIIAAGAAIWTAFFPGAQGILAKAGVTAPSVSELPAGPPGSQRLPAVVTSPVKSAVLDEEVTAMGTAKAARSVDVVPLGSGTVTEISVSDGGTVKAGQVIARLDSDTEELALRKAKVAATDAESALARARRLYETGAATAVQVQDAEMVLHDAITAADEAALALSRRSVVAPFDGTVGILRVQEGEQVTAQTVVARIEDRSSVIVDFWVHESRAGVVRPGMPLQASTPAWPGEVFKGTVEAVDGAVDEASRTLLARARIPNPDGKLRAGMSFKVTVKGTGREYPAVDPLAIQWSSDGPYVWAVKDGKAVKVAVGIVRRKIDEVLVTGDLSPGDFVVTEGLHSVRSGMAIANGDTE